MVLKKRSGAEGVGDRVIKKRRPLGRRLIVLCNNYKLVRRFALRGELPQYIL